MLTDTALNSIPLLKPARAFSAAPAPTFEERIASARQAWADGRWSVHVRGNLVKTDMQSVFDVLKHLGAFAYDADAAIDEASALDLCQVVGDLWRSKHDDPIFTRNWEWMLRVLRNSLSLDDSAPPVTLWRGFACQPGLDRSRLEKVALRPFWSTDRGFAIAYARASDIKTERHLASAEVPAAAIHPCWPWLLTTVRIVDRFDLIRDLQITPLGIRQVEAA